MVERQERIAALAKTMFETTGNSGSLKVYEALAAAAVLHAEKNAGYRSEADPFANFKENPVVEKGLLCPSQYAYILMSKQDDALPRLLWSRSNVDDPREYKKRGGDEMLSERCLDGIIYRAIILALIDQEPA